MLKPLTLPGPLFDALARGYGGAPAGRWLRAAERSKQQLLLRSVVAHTEAAAHPVVPDLRRAYAALAALQADDATRASVEAVLRHPAVACWAIQTIRTLREGGEGGAARRMTAVAAAAAIRAGVPYTGVTIADSGAVVLPSVGAATFPGLPSGTLAEVVVTRRGTRIEAGGQAVTIPADPTACSHRWTAMRQIDVTAGGLRFVIGIDDFDPYRFPPGPALATRLTEAEAQQWAASFGQAWQLLAGRHRRVATELCAIITAVTPLRHGPEAELNATSREAFGGVGLSRPRGARSLALALAHEIQHAKLAALLDLLPLVKPGTTALYYAPWRADPRPPLALLHGAYAFLGVADFWRRQREHERGSAALQAHAEYARWRDGSAEAAQTLSAGDDLTQLGHRFLSGMRSTLTDWQRQAVPPAAARLARSAAEHHRDTWMRQNALQIRGGSNSNSRR
jgi:HEXXH motif-containing protein